MITAFRSRAESFKLKETLAARGIYAEIVSTPKEAKIGCGYSVKTHISQFKWIKYSVPRYGFKSFAGCYIVEETADGREIKGVYR